MGWVSGGEIALAVVLLLACALIAGLFLRRRALSHGGVVVDCALRLPGAPDTGWITGIARYHDEDLEWFKVFSLSVRPKVVLGRRVARVESHRLLSPEEAEQLPGLDVVTRLSDPSLEARGRGSVELAMSRSSATALMSWMEASPPGLPRVIG